MDYIEQALTSTNAASLDVDTLEADVEPSNDIRSNHGYNINNNNRTKEKSRSYHRQDYITSKPPPEALRQLQRRQREASDKTMEAAASSDSGLHSQLHGARDNIQQTDLAINSILSTGLNRREYSTSTGGGGGGSCGGGGGGGSGGGGRKASGGVASDTDDADETSWNIEQLKQQQNPAGDSSLHYDDPLSNDNVIYEEDIAGTVDISSSKFVLITLCIINHICIPN